ncbi:MAG TPA: SoxR reducing system RseC family protein [Tissierellia bacterium]|nr:SoxR reducing system RseC family protein [Tissierellia bacterium]
MVQARIIRQEKDLFRVETVAGNLCEGCTSCSKGRGGLEVLAKADRDYRPGELVDIDMPSADLNAAAFWVYGLPLIIILAGIYLGTLLAPVIGLGNWSEVVGVTLGIALGAVYYLVMKTRQGDMNKTGRFTATIVGPASSNLCQLETSLSKGE